VVALGLLLQAAAAASPIETARLHLARGDTAPAVTALLPLAVVRDTVTTDQLTALVLLQWIGRSDSQRRAREAWLAAGATLNLILAHGPAAGVLLGAVVVDEADVVVDDELRGQFGALRWTTWASSLRDQTWETDAALAGAAAWVLVERYLLDLRLAIDGVPPAFSSRDWRSRIRPPGAPTGSSVRSRRRPPLNSVPAAASFQPVLHP
jgi:hypothetical protein